MSGPAEEVPYVALASVAEVRLGRQRSPDRANGPHMTPYMRAANVGWDGLRLDDIKEMDFSPDERRTYELQDGDILVGEASGSRAEVGKSALWRCEVQGACFQNTLIRVRVDQTRALPEYVRAHLLRDARSGALANAARGVGIHHLGREALASWPIRLPPLDDQRRIVAHLDACFARTKRAKAALDEVPALLDRLRQSILAAAFRGDLTADWRAEHPDVEPASELLKRIRVERRRRWEEAELAKMVAKGKPPKDDRWKAKYEEPEPVDESELPELPEGWCWASLDEMCDPTRGITYGIVQTGDDTPDGVPTVRCGDIRDFSVRVGSLKRVAPGLAAQFGRTTLRGGEVIIAIRGTVGATASATADMVCMNVSREVAVLPLLGEVDQSFVMFGLGAPEAQARVGARVKGVAQSGINIADLKRLAFAVPSSAEQQEVVAAIRRSLASVERVATSVDVLQGRARALDSAVLSVAFCETR